MASKYDPALMRRLVRSSLLAWTAITAALWLYVLRTYPSELSAVAVAGRQAANWMPFSLVLPALYAWAARMGRRPGLALWIAVGGITVLAYTAIRFAAILALSLATEMVSEGWLVGLGRMWPIATIVYGVTVAVLLGVFAQVGRERAEKNAQRLESELMRAQLASLQSQIHPHFLFNTLQTIENACWEDSRTASRMVLQLSDLLRASLDGKNQPVKTLGDDLDLARKYIAIQSERFGKRLRFEEEVDAETMRHPFPTLFLQPLLENAIVHGIESLPEGGTVHLRAAREDDTLVLRLTNDGPAIAGSNGRPEGIGLANTVARLHSVFGPSADLTITPRPGGGASVEVRTAWKADD